MRLGPTGSIGFLFSPSSCFSESATPRGRGPALVFDAIGGEKKKGIGEEFGTGTWTGTCLFGAPRKTTGSEHRSHSYGAVARWAVRSLRSCVAVPPPPPPHVLAALLVDGGPALAGLTQPKSPARSVSFVTLRIGVLKLQASGSATGDDGVGLHGIGRN